MNCRDAEELITALADNELSESERGDIAEHLLTCSGCRVRHQQELALKTELRKATDTIRAPARLREKILHDQRIPPAAPIASAHRFFRPQLIAALVVLLLLPALYLMRPSSQPIVLTALRTHEKILKNELSLVGSGSPEALRARLSESVGGAFAPMTYDLSSIRKAATAGALVDWNGRKVLVMIYQGDGPSITCYTFPGTEADAPSGAEGLYDPDRKTYFYAYSHNGMNLVFHREGKLICILVSSLPMPELLAIARKS